MNARTKRRQILLSTATLIGALSGYGRSAYAQTPPGSCDRVGVTSNFECRGKAYSPQSVNLDNASVSTEPGFSAENKDPFAIQITGDGALSYTDVNASELRSSGTALDISAAADDGSTAGSVTVKTNGALSGGFNGIQAHNFGSGKVSVTATGDVTGTTWDGISAGNFAGADITVTTGKGTTVKGFNTGINAYIGGSGELNVTANGNVTGGLTGATKESAGIRARNGSGKGLTDITVITGKDTSVTGGDNGIYARNSGSGELAVTANGDVSGIGQSSNGIYAQNGHEQAPSGTNLTVTTGEDTKVTGAVYGITANNYGSGALKVTANGDVTGIIRNRVAKSVSYQFSAGINARNGDGQTPAGTDLTVETGVKTTVTGGTYGIRSRHYGKGAHTVTADGDVKATDKNSNGIFAQNGNGRVPAGTDLTVSTGKDTTVSGGAYGIKANNYGKGALKVTTDGDVTGTEKTGISAKSSGGADLTVTTGIDTKVTGGEVGIDAQNYGRGALTVTAKGDATGTATVGIRARNGSSRAPAGTDLTVETGENTTVTGDLEGISAQNFGSGVLTIIAKGDVTSTADAFSSGIRARNGSAVSRAGTDLTLTTDEGTTVSGGAYGINAVNYGKGALAITANGDVTGTNGHGIHAGHLGGGPIDVTVGSGSTVMGTSYGIKISKGEANLTVAGTVTGAGGTAVVFDQRAKTDDRLELHPTAVVKGNVLAGPGTDTLALGGTGAGTFDMSSLDTGANTQQFQDFEIFEVVSGTWSLTGDTKVPYVVEGGTLKGTGTFGNLTIQSGGIIAPGNSIGTMIVNGAFTLSAGAIYEVEVNAAGESDKVVVQGTVNLTGATLQVIAATGKYKAKTDYVIIENDGSDAVTGAFAAITSSLAFLTPSVLYNGGTGNDVVLTLERNETLFPDVARTRNQRAVAGALSQFATDNELYLAVLNQTADGARQAFDALSGEIHATISGVLADESRYVREAILGRLTQAGHADESLAAAGPQMASLDANAMALGYDNIAAPSSPLAFWTEAYGAWGSNDGVRNAASVDRDLGGFVSGMDAQLSGSWRVGLAAGASYSSIDVSDRHSSADVDSFLLAGYAGGMAGAFALKGGGTWSWNDIETSRAVIFPGFFEREEASYDADTSQVFGEIAYPTSLGGVALEPFAGLAYVSVDADSFRERGELAALRGANTDQDVGYSTFGLRVAGTMHLGQTLVTPHFSAAWQHAFNDVTPGAALAFASTGIAFDVTGVPLAKNSALIDAGLDFALAENLNAGVSYSGQFGPRVQDNAVKGQLTWLF